MLTLPTRDFLLVVDPASLEDLLKYPLKMALGLVEDLADLDPSVNVRLIFPLYLATDGERDVAKTGRAPLEFFPEEIDVPKLTLARDLGRRVRERIERGAEGDCRGLRLLALAEHIKADGVVTSIPSLMDSRYALLRHHKFRIVPPPEVPDFVEVCARGHSIFCSAISAPRWLPPDVLYQVAHWKNRRFAQWFGKASPALSDEIIREHLRSALLNRYPMILYARDMVRFFELQKDYHFRRAGQPPVFRAPLNYHLTAFYVHAWGMLDSLSGIANRHLGLGVPTHKCGVVSGDFLKALSRKRPGLVAFIKRYTAEWISIIGDVRHPVAHSALRLQRDLAAATDESKKSDAEIAAILRKEDPETYRVLPPDLIRAVAPVLIDNWRLSKMKVITDDAIYVERADGSGYFRNPVASIDFDLERVNAFIDAFLVGCFGQPPPAAARWWSRALRALRAASGSIR